MQTSLTIILAVILLGIGYLYFSYARIYNYIGEKNFLPPTAPRTYLLGNKNSKEIIRYVALGDSLTAGVGSTDDQQTLPFLIGQKLLKGKGEVLIVNLGQPGATSLNVLHDQLPKAIGESPDVVTLLIGINDVHNLVSLKDFQTNYQQIINELTQKTHAKVIAINLPYLGSDVLVYPPYNFLLDFRTRQFNTIISQIAREKSVSYVDLYTKTKDLFRKNPRLYSGDQFHPSDEGYKIWGDLIDAN